MANLETTQELNKLLKEQNKLLLAQSKIMKSQAATMKAMVASMQKMPVEDVNRSFNEMNDAIKDADKALEDFSGEQQKAMEGLQEGAEQASEEYRSLADTITEIGEKSVVVGVLVTTFNGLNAGARAAVGVFGSMLSVASTLTKSFFNLTTSIIAIPFKMMSALMEEAASMSGTEFRQAIADLRKEMGSLATNEGAAVMKSFRNMRKEGVETGLSNYRVFGNMAERLKFVTELAKSLGRTFNQFSDEVRENGARIGSYQKGLGLSEEGMANLGKAAAATGKSLIETGREMTTMAYGMGEAFGINGKLISRDMAEMAGDFENFGSVGSKTMASIAVFTRKLGIEVKDLLGLVSKFDDFEDAAQSAAQLSQAFGIQVDTLQMLKEQDPAARFETMRKAFHATGKSIEGLNRQELALLSSQSGISAEALKIGFAQGKQNMSYKDVQKESEKTEKKQLSQAEAMAKLSDSIELMVKSGAQMKGGFFDIFIQGFTRGMRISGPFRKMLRSLRRAMHAVRMAGVKVGRMFVDTFPGVKDIMEGLRESFENFGRFTRTSDLTGFLGKVVEDFREFFKALTTDPKTALKTLFKNLSEDFFDKLTKDKPAGQKVLNGFKQFFVVLGGLFASGIDMAMEGLTTGLEFLADFIAHPEAALASISGAQSGMGKFFADVFGPAAEAIQNAWPALEKAFMGLWGTLRMKFEVQVIKFAKDALDFVILVGVGASIFRFFIASFMAGMAKFGEVIVKWGAPKLAGALSKMFGLVPKTGGLENKVKDFNAMATGSGSMGGVVSKQGGMMSKLNLKSMAKGLIVGIIAITAVSMAMAANFLLLSYAFLGAGVKTSDVMMVGKIMAIMGALYLETALVIAGSFLIGAMITGPQVAVVLIGIAAIAAVATGMVGHTIELIKAIDKMPVSSGISKKVDLFAKVMGAVASMGEVMSSVAKNSSSVFQNVRAMFYGGNPMIEGMEALKGFMGEMFKHMRGIVSQIATITRGISPDQIEAGAMIGTLLGALGSLMESFQPEEQGLYDKYLVAVGAVPDELSNVSRWMTKLIGIMTKNIMPAIIMSLDMIARMPAVPQEKIATFTTFMTGFSQLLKAMVPPPSLMEAMKDTSKSSFLGFETTSSTAGDPEAAMKGMSAFMDKMMSIMTGPDGALTKIQKFMGSIVEATNKLGDPTQIKTATDLFSTTMDAMAQVGDMFSPEKMKAFQEAGGNSTVGVMLSNFTSNVMLPMEQEMPKIFSAYERMGKNAKDVKLTFVKKMTSNIKDMVASINSVTDDLTNLNIKPINVQLKKVGDTLGMAGSNEFKIEMDRVNINLEVKVNLDPDDFEKTLISRPGGSNFAVKNGKAVP